MPSKCLPSLTLPPGSLRGRRRPQGRPPRFGAPHRQPLTPLPDSRLCRRLPPLLAPRRGAGRAAGPPLRDRHLRAPVSARPGGGGSPSPGGAARGRERQREPREAVLSAGRAGGGAGCREIPARQPRGGPCARSSLRGARPGGRESPKAGGRTPARRTGSCCRPEGRCVGSPCVLVLITFFHAPRVERRGRRTPTSLPSSGARGQVPALLLAVLLKGRFWKGHLWQGPKAPSVRLWKCLIWYAPDFGWGIFLSI